MEYFVVCTTQINFTQRKMFLGKWNSDNSYYLYEQIKTLFYEVTGMAVFIWEDWMCCPLHWHVYPRTVLQLCWPCGKAQEPVLSPEGLGPEQGLPCSPWVFWSLRLSWGQRCLSSVRAMGGDSMPASIARLGKRSEEWPLALLQKLDELRDASTQTQSFTAAVENLSSAKLIFQSFALTVVMLIQPLGPVIAVAPCILSNFWHKPLLSLNSEESQASAIQSNTWRIIQLYVMYQMPLKINLNNFIFLCKPCIWCRVIDGTLSDCPFFRDLLEKESEQSTRFNLAI